MSYFQNYLGLSLVFLNLNVTGLYLLLRSVIYKIFLSSASNYCWTLQRLECHFHTQGVKLGQGKD